MRTKVFRNYVGWEFQKYDTKGKQCLTRVDLVEGDADIGGKLVCLGITKIGPVLP